ncbi:hypothetical protein KR074_009995 [Drosophila pseudoananassae]|nr:hypothetical protein KR074_009995 [Drosophila pseudoananassae]
MFRNLCRLCATNTSTTNAIKLFLNDTRIILHDIELLTGVLVSTESVTVTSLTQIIRFQLQCGPDLPDWMCETCQQDLKSAIDFRERCLKSQKVFEEPEGDLSSGSSKATSHSLSTRLGCVRRSTRCRSRNNKSAEPVLPPTPMEVMIKLESLSNTDGDDDGVDHLDSSHEADLERAIKEMSISEEEEDKPLITNRGKRRGRPKSAVKLKKRPKASLTVFFCDQCGKNITGKSSFDRHLRKHSGIRPFQCQTCPARFLSAGELKGHQVMHTGDRNFPCRYCERSYVNYSGRMRHERTHTNDRPFACHQCGKTFTNSYILKNHMLIHTGERLFRCELCQRSFARPTHLNTHYRSNTHKHNVEKAKVGSESSQSQSQPNEQIAETQPEEITYMIEVPLPLDEKQEEDTSLELATLGTSTLVYSTN